MSLKNSITSAQIGGVSSDATGVAKLEFRFNRDDSTFAGHFPGRPIVPGAFQIEMARMGAEQVLGCALKVREIGKAKFLRPIAPNELVRMDLKLSEVEGTIRVRATFSVDGQRAGEVLLHLWRCA